MTLQVSRVGDSGPHITREKVGQEVEVKETKLEKFQEKVSKEKLEEIVEETKLAIDFFNKKLDFKVHEGTDRIMVKVVEKDTGKIIREIPPEEILDLAARIDNFLGIFLDEKA